MEKSRKNKGITLIALVITIIVLLILAGVTIATLTGDNGILTQANKAKTTNKEGEASEQFALLANEWAIEKNTSNKTLDDFLNEKLTEGKLSSIEDNGDGTYTIKLNGYQTIIDQNGKTSSVFNPEEWDKTACKESSFLWESDDPNSGEAYHTIVGYADSMQDEVVLKIPSRCHEIRCDYENWYGQGRIFVQNTFDTIELPNTLVKIGKYAFSCFRLTNVKIPNSVTSIESNAFSYCYNLSSIEIPSSVTSIGDWAFVLCSSLNNTEIPRSLTSIGVGAFDRCTSLSSITIPNSVTIIGDHAFSEWTSSQIINIQGYSSAPSGWNSAWNSNCSATINWNQ